MIGILLAGGAATRLPNKPLLPTKHGCYPVCLSGLDYLKRHKVSHTIIVTPPNSPLVDVITHFRPGQSYTFVYQAEPTGVGDALNLAMKEIPIRAMVVMADNIYPENEEFPHGGGAGIAIRKVAAWKRPHLVGANGLTHLSRTAGEYCPFALTTPWVIGPGREFDKEGWPTLRGQKQIEMEEEGWWDIGTPELYAAYWRSA
jgi:hypothetical protein